MESKPQRAEITACSHRAVQPFASIAIRSPNPPINWKPYNNHSQYFHESALSAGPNSISNKVLKAYTQGQNKITEGH